MIKLHPQYLIKNGKKEFVVLPYSEFLALQVLVEDAKDLIELRKAKQAEKDAPTISFKEATEELDL